MSFFAFFFMTFRKAPMALIRGIWILVVSIVLSGFAQADHHNSHHHGPHRGIVVDLEGVDTCIELVLTDGQEVTAYVLDQDLKPAESSLEYLTLTFTEPDGEKEDYKIEATKKGQENVFQRTSGHVVHHIIRDPIVVSITKDGKKYSSAQFSFPHGPHGGEVISLGKGAFIAELCVQGDVVAIHVLDKQKRAVKVDSKEITLTFTEPDGEVEDYGIAVDDTVSKGSTFKEVDDHIVKHVKRDPIVIKLVQKGVSHESESFRYSK